MKVKNHKHGFLGHKGEDKGILPLFFLLVLVGVVFFSLLFCFILILIFDYFFFFFDRGEKRIRHTKIKKKR